MVEHNLAKVGVAGSSLVFRSENSKPSGLEFFFTLFVSFNDGRKGDALVAELVDAQDLKSCLPQGEYGFNSRLGHWKSIDYEKGCIAAFFFTTTILQHFHLSRAA